jgi:UDP-glucose 4-epimerase
MLGGKAPVVFGDGSQSRDFTYIDNAVQANILAATNDKIVGSQYNVACGGQFTINETIDLLNEILGTNLKAEYVDERMGDIKHSYASIDKLKSFGFDPTVSFKDGLIKTVEYYKEEFGY